ncbi:hypothetical protein GC197_05030 [bacterium]|nr:hypothetical protein [bacterium]
MTRFLLATTFVFASLLAGCQPQAPGKQPGRFATVPVTGTVTLDGKPVPDATIMFFSEQLKITAYGKTDVTGQYGLTTYAPQDGAPKGHYLVCVKKSEQKIVEDSAHPALPPVTTTKNLLPKRYADFETSQLEAEVSPGQQNSFGFELHP